MYEAFYGLREKPFSLVPDPHYLYLSRRHKAAILMLKLALTGQAGFSTITGEVGSGKTTIARHFLDIARDNATIGMITNTYEEQGDIVQWILFAFGLEYKGKNNVESFETFVDFLYEQFAKGKQTILLIDEAQNLSPAALEQLRVFSNIYDEQEHVLQIFLIGQPELLEKLNRPDLKQLAQRISVNFQLGPLNINETTAYIRHRSRIAGASRVLFDEAASAAVYYFTGGIPRLINMLCDYSLMYAFSEKEPSVRHEIVWSVVCDKKESGLNVFQNTKHIGDRKRVFREILKLSTEINIAESNDQSDGSFQNDEAALSSTGNFEPSQGDEDFLPEPEMIEKAKTGFGRRIARYCLITGFLALLLLAGRAGWLGVDIANAIFVVENTASNFYQGSAPEPSQLYKVDRNMKSQNATSKLDEISIQPSEKEVSSTTVESPPAETEIGDSLPGNPKASPVKPSKADQFAAHLDNNKLDAQRAPTALSLAEFFKFQQRPIALQRAGQLLASLWGYDEVKLATQDPCQIANEAQLSCFTEPASLERLSAYNRPAILTLRTPEGELSPVVLSALVDGTATLRTPKVTIVSEVSEIAPVLTGKHVVFWNRPLIYTRLLQRGVSGPDVAWVKQRLNDLKISSGGSSPGDIFDDAFEEQVKQFQSNHNLTADGIVGPQTLICLNAVTAPKDGPRLRSGAFKDSQSAASHF